MWECGLKRRRRDAQRLGRKSLPMWECGLKHLREAHFFRQGTSLPMWECGLKHRSTRAQCLIGAVTPHVGVWIETGAIRGR